MFKSLKVKTDKNTQAFFALLRAGLWEHAYANLNDKVDWLKLYQLAEEQSVIGVVLSGIEHSFVKPPQDLLLQWIGEVQLLEQQNKAMNIFIADLVEKMRNVGIYTLLLKGQGVAQCYERPMWRASGDVDFFLSKENYEKAKAFLTTISTTFGNNTGNEMHYELTIDNWIVDLHGSFRCGLSSKIDKVIEDIQHSVFCDGDARSWINGKTQVFLPGANSDVFFIFTHFLKHFYRGGLGLRQICDWCRLLWTYRSKLDSRLLESRIRQMGLMSEWRAFGAFAVEYLGMPSEAMPFYSPEVKWKKKASRISDFVMEVGNMGHNRDMSYFEKYPYLIRKVCSLCRRLSDLISHARIFPMDSLRFFPRIMFNGLRSAARGE